MIVLQTSWGYDLFDWLGKRVTEFLDHTDVGAQFVFGDKFTDHFFAFKVNKCTLYTAVTKHVTIILKIRDCISVDKIIYLCFLFK